VPAEEAERLPEDGAHYLTMTAGGATAVDGTRKVLILRDSAPGESGPCVLPEAADGSRR
jgi:hypothetical protein